MNHTHVIQRHLLAFSLPQREGAFEIQNRLSALYKTEILNVLQQLCDQAAGSDQFLQIEKLEIDLGMIKLDRLEDEFVARFRLEFEEALSGRALQVMHARGAKAALIPGAATGAEPDLQGQIADGNDRLMSVRAMRLKLVQYFLRSGRLPWWSSRPSADILEPILRELLETAPGQLTDLVQTEIRSRSARLRLIYQFSDDFLIRLTASAASEPEQLLKTWFQVLIQGLQQARLPDMTPSAMRLLVWDAILSNFGQVKRLTIDFLQTVLDTIIRRHQRAEPVILNALQTAIKQSERSSHLELIISIQPLIEARLRRLRSQPKRLELDTASVPKVRGVTRADIRQGLEAVKDASTGATGPKRNGTRDTERTRGQTPAVSAKKRAVAESAEQKPVQTFEFRQETDDLQKLAIQNAGLVILWPFFKNFFDSLGLLDAGGAIRPQEAVRAIHLLQYLVTGERETPEFMLPLNKLLCGWDLDKPVSKAVEFTPAEINEADQLLQAVIGHWSALKRTSVDGLRVSFLQRDGMLSKTKNHWLLQVELIAHDIMLERLPWGISMIKLSWMKKMLRVDWTKPG